MTKIQLRRGTAAQWTSVNPVLASGEMGIETDTNKFKFGDGVTAWNNLDYVITGEVITDYTELDNLPSINNITLTGNKSASDLGLQEGLINGTGILISGTTISVDDSVVAMQSDIPDVSNFVTNSSLSTTLQDYQPLLNSGVNIKTINNQSLLGSGNIEIQGGGTPTNMVTTNTPQNISGRKTFLGEKAIFFKQQAASNKLGFTLYNPSNTELGALEWRPNTIGSASLLTLNCPQTTGGYVGFRYWGKSAVNIVAPNVATAGNYFIPTHITDGNTTVTANNQGTVNISTLLPDLSGYATQNWVTSQGYTSNVGTVTSVNNTQPDANGNVSITIPDNTTFMDLSTNQTAYGTKTFNDLRVHQYIRNVAGKVIFYGVGSSFSVGDTTCELTLDGSTTRPYYYNGTTNSEMALLSDIPTVPDIDNTTITKNADDELQTVAVIDNNSGNALKYWTGTKAQYDAIATKDANTLYFLTDVGLIYLGETLISNNSNGKNIGELVYSSLPQTDAGLHLLDGALIQGSGSYSAFVDYIADLYTANPSANYFTTEAAWQNSVTTYGVCGKFVYDSTNNTVRLPKVTGIIEGTVDISALGDLVEAGLPSITGHTHGVLSNVGSTIPTAGAIYEYQAFQVNSVGTGSGTFRSYGIDASRCSSIYKGNFNKVQPQTIKMFVYIVIATSTKTDIQVDIDEIATDLNGKADTDLSNTTDQAKILMGGMAMPSNKYIDLTLGTSGSTYTAPANGYYNIGRATNGQNPQYIDLVNTTTGFFVSQNNEISSVIRLNAPVRKGDILRINYTAVGGSGDFFRFYYAQGSESEAN